MEGESEYMIKNVSYDYGENGPDELPAKESEEINEEKRDTTESANEKKVLKREIIRDGFGTITMDGGERIVHRYTLTNKRGMYVQVINYGATITSVMVPDKKGNLDDIVLGYETIEGYTDPSNPYFGATMGRVTGIIENASFKLGTEEFDVSPNFIGCHHANGGFKGFDKVIWHAHIQDKKLMLSYMSKDGEEGFPGDVIVERTFELTSRNELIIITTATCTKPTLVDVSTHVDWNLASNLAGPKEMYNHYLMINADRYAQKDSDYMATGKLKKVTGTVFDFRIPRLLGRLIHKVPGGGYDDYLSLISSDCKSVIFAARLMHPGSGRFLEVLTDQLGLTIYTGNKLFAKECYTVGHPESFWSFKPTIINEPEKSITENEENPRNSQQSAGDGGDNEQHHDVEEIESQENEKSHEEVIEKTEENEGQDEEGKETQEENEAENVEKDTEESKEQAPQMKGKMGVIYERHGGIRLVPHNSAKMFLKKEKLKDGLILKPGKKYSSRTIFKFGVVSKKTPDLAEIV